MRLKRLFASCIFLASTMTSTSMAATAIDLTGSVTETGVNYAIPGANVSLVFAKLNTTTDTYGLFAIQGTPNLNAIASKNAIQIQNGLMYLNLASPQNVRVQTQNSLGQSQVLFEKTMGEGVLTIDLLSQSPLLASGFYLLDVQIGNGHQRYSLIKTEHGNLDVQKNAFAQTTATPTVVDTLVVSKAGFTTSRTPITSYSTPIDIQLTSTKTKQTITFNTLSDKMLGSGNVTLTATSSSGLAVTFTSGTPTICTVAGNSVTLIKAGSCVINADQAGNTTYNVAPQVQQSFNVKSTQTITFGALSAKYLSDPAFAISATASSGLTVAFTSATPSICTVSGSTVSLVAMGTCTINANQAGNTFYTAATQVQQSFTVNAAQPNPCGGTTSGLKNWFTQACFDKLFPKKSTAKCVTDGNSIYTYANFMAAAAQWPNFGSEGTIVQQKRDVAAFLAHVNQETGGASGDSAFSLCYVYERAAMPNKTLSTYDAASYPGSPYQPVSGQHYFGRGPFQISWPANYGWFSQDVLGDMNILLSNPDKVATDGVIAFKTALWFWNEKQDYWLSPLPPTLHSVIVNGTTYQTWSGFGATTKVINGDLECKTGNSAMLIRGKYYVSYQKSLGLATGDLDQTNVNCNVSSSY